MRQLFLKIFYIILFQALSLICLGQCGYVINESVTDVTCKGLCNGTAGVDVTGGAPPYSYNWQIPNSDTSEISSLCPGNYYVVITDNNGCDSSFAIEVNGPDALVTTISKTNEICEFKGNFLASTTGGNLPYQYGLNNEFSSAFSYTELDAGTYVLITLDSKNCADTNEVVIEKMECEQPIPETIFSPNGDGYNDTWGIVNIFQYPNCLISVFDRWGQRVYYNKGYDNPWDGTNASVPLLVEN